MGIKPSSCMHEARRGFLDHLRGSRETDYMRPCQQNSSCSAASGSVIGNNRLFSRPIKSGLTRLLIIVLRHGAIGRFRIVPTCQWNDREESKAQEMYWSYANCERKGRKNGGVAATPLSDTGASDLPIMAIIRLCEV